MGNHGADIEGVVALVEVIQILGEGFPGAPGHALVQGGAGNVFNAFHQLDQVFFFAAVHRRKPYAAIAHHQGGHTVAGGWVEHIVPGGLAVVVGVNIDPAGGDDAACGVYGFFCCSTDAGVDGDDNPVADANVAAEWCGAKAVDNGGAPDQVIEHEMCASLLFREPLNND